MGSEQHRCESSAHSQGRDHPRAPSGCSAAARGSSSPLACLAHRRVGCGRRSDARFVVGFSQCNLGEPWRVAMNADVAARAKDFPQMEIVFADAQQDNAKQVADVENFLRQGVNLLMISPNEAKPLTAVVRKAYERGIPVIVIDRASRGRHLHGVHRRRQPAHRPPGRRSSSASCSAAKGDIVEIKGPAWLAAGPRSQRGDARGDRRLSGHPHRPRPGRQLAARGGDDADGDCARRARSHRPGLRAQRSDGRRRLPGGQGEGARRRDEVHRHRRAARTRTAAARRSPTASSRRRSSTRREDAEAVETAAKILAGESVPRHITLASERISRTAATPR